jgi:hypothetical protein
VFNKKNKPFSNSKKPFDDEKMRFLLVCLYHSEPGATLLQGQVQNLQLPWTATATETKGDA